MSTETKNQKPTPAYVQFCETLRSRCQALGLELDRAPTETGLPQNAGYAFVRVKGGPALIVPKAVGGVKRIDCHLSVPGREPAKPNGRVMSVLSPEDVTDELLTRLALDSKRPVARPQGKSTAAPQGATPALTDAELAAVVDGL